MSHIRQFCQCLKNLKMIFIQRYITTKVKIVRFSPKSFQKGIEMGIFDRELEVKVTK